MEKPNLRHLNLDQMKAYFVEIGEKPFRAKQVYEWIWKKSARTFDQMTNLSIETRAKLEDKFSINPVSVQNHQKSNDRTIKNAFQLHDGYVVEGVLIPTDTRMTACVKLGDDGVKFNLALSLHAANDAKRSQIMPINESNSLEVLEEALKYFYDKTGTRITLEYIVFKDFNDTLQDAKELATFARKVPTKINLIEYNSIGDSMFTNTSEDKLNKFFQYLAKEGHIVNLRRSRGKDIDAACGQLANKSALK